MRTPDCLCLAPWTPLSDSSCTWKICGTCVSIKFLKDFNIPAEIFQQHGQVQAASRDADWRSKAKPIKEGSTYPAKELCSHCGLCDTYYVAHVKDACAFLGDGKGASFAPCMIRFTGVSC